MRRAAAGLGLAAWLAVAGPAAAQSERVLETARDVSYAVRRCWQVPEGLRRFERLEATVRFSLRVDGDLIGVPRVAYMPFPAEGFARELMARSVVEAIQRCVPLRLADTLGGAIAGRVFAVRFIYRGPQGQGA